MKEIKPPCHQQTEIHQAIDNADIPALSGFLSDNVILDNYINSGEHLVGKEQALAFFKTFFKKSKKERFIYYRVIDNGRNTGILDERLAKYYPNYEFLLFIEDCKIVKMELFDGLGEILKMTEMLNKGLEKEGLR